MFKLQVVQLALVLGYQCVVIGYKLEKISKDNIIDLSDMGSALYGPRDYTLDKVLSKAYNHNATDFNPGDINPEELGSYLEGDLLVPTDNDNGLSTRSGLTQFSTFWPGGILPYVLDGDFERHQIRMILRAFDNYAAKTCIRFIPRTIEKDYIAFQNTKSGCFSAVGRMGGKQIINFAKYCYTLGTVCHEIMHALGFFHEQARYDRDKYVKILYDNVQTDYIQSNFLKKSSKNTTNYGIPYDYLSIMHYQPYAFTKNHKITIQALKPLPKGKKMGQRVDFSQGDLDKIRARYCNKKN